ncbi:MAG: hypothetical protein MUC95_07190 [Spirochaetes bacterium]|nr:hypothetical protein [Spirochaetota bacterium]
MESKIISVSDVVEAIATSRPYRTKPGVEQAHDEIKSNRGSVYFINIAWHTGA